MSTTTSAADAGENSNTSGRPRPAGEGLEDVVREQLELPEVGRHRVEHKVLDPASIRS
jgi:hypothetical protein